MRSIQGRNTFVDAVGAIIRGSPGLGMARHVGSGFRDETELRA
jgi:hypothetical protein